MTTHSRERREAVVDALIAADGKDNDPSVDYYELADAALAAALPDRETLTLALARLAQATYDDGMHGRAVPSYAANLDHVLSLVYGADDAQAGDQEGAEHE